jgi:hypothetical protein
VAYAAEHSRKLHGGERLSLWRSIGPAYKSDELNFILRLELLPIFSHPSLGRLITLDRFGPGQIAVTLSPPTARRHWRWPRPPPTSDTRNGPRRWRAPRERKDAGMGQHGVKFDEVLDLWSLRGHRFMGNLAPCML